MDEATSKDRQIHMLDFICSNILKQDFAFSDKDGALKFFQALRQLFRGWNSAEWNSGEFASIEKEAKSAIALNARKALGITNE